MANTKNISNNGAGAGARLLSMWSSLARYPGGRWLFSRLFARMVPYSGSIGARVVELAPGRAVLALRDRRAVRNHLGSIHAIALANLGELASGLATQAALPPGVRSIVTGLSIEYLKKARGCLTASSSVILPEAIARETVEHEVIAEIRDESDDVVARTRVTWRIGPVPPQD